MKKTLFISVLLLSAAFALRAQNVTESTAEIVNNVVEQSQQAADEAKQAYQDQARTGNREISRLERRISSANKEVDRLKAEADQLKADIKTLDKSKKVQDKCGFKYHHTNPDTRVIMLDETRVEHFGVLTKEEFLARRNIKNL